MTRKIVERKVYYRWTENRAEQEKVDLFLSQHVNVTYRGETRKAWVHRLNPIKVEIVIYGGPTLRVDPFTVEPLETQHW